MYYIIPELEYRKLDVTISKVHKLNILRKSSISAEQFNLRSNYTCSWMQFNYIKHNIMHKLSCRVEITVCKLMRRK